ncbi:NosR/NirI family protein [Rhodoblastus sp.]|uniref:NosR/NirI family protein n=1 Tax=Rhodoblastus sp. TaxID=1962975 RepID=UPI0025E31800|nr:NosR/NirI family protein [Rhodoblastus sp.]
MLAIARLFGIILGVLLWLAAAAPCFALASQLQQYIGQVPAAEFAPGADHYGPVQGSPPTAKIFAGDRLLGYAFVNADWVNSTGYSGQPIQILEGLSTDGKISGARLMAHHEPIVLIGIPPERIETFIRGYVGRDVLAISHSAPSDRPAVDIVSGATVTVAVIAESMVRAAIKVANAEGMGGPVAAVAAVRELDPSHAAPADWNALVSGGAVRRLSLSVGEVTEAFRRTGNENGVEHPEDADPATTFIDLYIAPVSIPAIGKSLLGADGFASLQKTLAPGQQAILVASNGAYSFKGSGYVRGGIFDRFEVLQGDSSIRFRDRDHTRIGDIHAVGAPSFRDVDLFRVPAGTALDPAQPWRLQLLAQRAYGSRDKAFLTFDVNYELPEAYLKPAPPTTAAAAAVNAPAPSAATDAQSTEPPMWHAMWRAKTGEISVLVGALALLTVIFFFQDWLVRRPVFYDRLRLGFLVFTLVWIGWIAQAQLSIVNVLAFLSALRTDFRWDYFLMAPLIFILWFAAAASLLFWNRGAYCGWLCPFGALQELTNRIARRLNIPQLKISFGVHQRLTALKYIIFLVLFGISLSDLGLAERLSEVEPFKTAIILKFARQWPFALYAGAMVASSLFVERAFCRYVCPMGAALAIPARLRLFDWLRRYRECGVPCQRCGNECPVQAIHPEGHINPNECIQCLHCQMLYHHDQKCPVMIQRRLKRERHSASSGAGASHVSLPPKTKVSAQSADQHASS